MAECEHPSDSVEHDEEQTDVDIFKLLPTGVCTACGKDVKIWMDYDGDNFSGYAWGYEVVK